MKHKEDNEKGKDNDRNSRSRAMINTECDVIEPCENGSKLEEGKEGREKQRENKFVGEKLKLRAGMRKR